MIDEPLVPMMNSTANVRPIASQRARMTWKSSVSTKGKVRNRAWIVVRVSQKCMTRVVRGLPHHDGLRTTWSIRIRTGIPTIRVMMSKYPVVPTVEHAHLFVKDGSLARITESDTGKQQDARCDNNHPDRGCESDE